MNKCKICGGDLKSTGNGEYVCVYCGGTYSDNDFIAKENDITPAANEVVDIFVDKHNPTFKSRTKALAPCPISWCGSKDTWIENGFFVCNACGFMEGDKIE